MEQFLEWERNYKESQCLMLGFTSEVTLQLTCIFAVACWNERVKCEKCVNMGPVNEKAILKLLVFGLICGILMNANGLPITCAEMNCTEIKVENYTAKDDPITEIMQTPQDLAARAHVDTVQDLVGEGQIKKVEDLLVTTEWSVGHRSVNSVPFPGYFGIDETTENSVGKSITTTQNARVEAVTTNQKMLGINTATTTMQTLIGEILNPDPTPQNSMLGNKTTFQNWLGNPGEAYAPEKFKLASMPEYKLPTESSTIPSTTHQLEDVNSVTPFALPLTLDPSSSKHKIVDAINSNEAGSLQHKVFPRKPEDNKANVSASPIDPPDPVTENDDSMSTDFPDPADAPTTAPPTNNNYVVPISSSEEMVRDPAPRESLPEDKFYVKTAYYNHVNNTDVAKLCSAAADCADTASLMYILVCGSDGVVYRNLGVLSCAQLCSVGLRFSHYGPCEDAKTVPPPTYLPPTSSKRPTQKTFIPRVKEYLRKRIRAKLRRPRYKYDLYKPYCDANPGVCPFHHSMYNATLFLIDVQPYEAEYT